ncbi:MAG: sensor histidine kinase [Tindallia sp. MSAO_Bac2]|nr:MAG: sensor histidine kinase [Tindallia sp. MSAO_Bac2]
MRIELDHLKESNEFLNTLLDHITSLVFILDQSLKVQCINGAVEELFEKEVNDLTDQIFGNAIKCSYAVEEQKQCQHTSYCNMCEFSQGLSKVLEQKMPTYKQKVNRDIYIGNKKVNKTFVFTTRHITYQNENMIMVVVDDVTELEKQRMELEKTVSLKNKLLGTVTHDLRNPINAIQNVSWFLMDEADKMTEEHRLFIKDIYEVSEYMSRLVDDLLDLSHIESGKLELNLKLNDYIETVRESVSINQPLALKKGMNILLDVPGTPLVLSYDFNKLIQVINNLIGNAIKFSDENSIITVGVQCNEEFVVTSVRDYGPGIPEDEVNQVFLEFSNLSARPTGNEKSTGLGLAIAKRIVEGHQGQIWVDSILGEGSVFYFSLPLHSTDNESLIPDGMID